MNEEQKNIETCLAEVVGAEVLDIGLNQSDVLAEESVGKLIDKATGSTHTAVKGSINSTITELPSTCIAFIRKHWSAELSMLGGISLLNAFHGAYDYLRLMGATITANLPQTVRSLVNNDWQANENGWAYDPKATYYFLCNEDSHTKYKPFLLLFFGNGETSIALSGANAYLTSDGDYYTADATHTWNADIHKSNRWVAYIFDESEDVDFVINSTTLSPQKIYVRGNFAKIRCTYTNAIGNINEIVVPDGSSVGLFSSAAGEIWSQEMTLRNIRTIGRLFGNGTYNITSFYFDGEDIVDDLTGRNNNSTTLQFTSCIMPNITNLRHFWINTRASLKLWWTPKLKTLSTPIDHSNSSSTGLNRIELPETTDFETPVGSYIYEGVLREVVLPKAEKTVTQLFRINGTNPNYSMGTPFTYIYIGYDTNDRTKAVILSTTTGTATFPNLTKIELKDGWCKPLNVAAASGLTSENMYNHILLRLKQDEPNCGSGVTITLGTTNIEKLEAVEEYNTKLTELEDTYGYTFA